MSSGGVQAAIVTAIDPTGLIRVATGTTDKYGGGPAGNLWSNLSGERGRLAGTRAARQQQEREDALLGQANARASQEESDAAKRATTASARRRQRALAVGGGGANPTLLTGPMGLTGEPSGAAKTLLGT